MNSQVRSSARGYKTSKPSAVEIRNNHDITCFYLIFSIYFLLSYSTFYFLSYAYTFSRFTTMYALGFYVFLAMAFSVLGSPTPEVDLVKRDVVGITYR